MYSQNFDGSLIPKSRRMVMVGF